MKAHALICTEKQRFSIEEVALPPARERHMVVRTLYSGVSIGTEFALIRNKLSWGPYPLCTGYQAVGVVERVGKQVKGFKPGNKVYYRDNKPMSLGRGKAVSSVAGTHCSHAIIDPNDTHGVALLPKGVDPAAGSLFVMPAVGLNGVDMANPRMGSTAAVYGAGLIGLGVVAACAHRGCTVIAIDIDDARLAVARKLGADYTINASEKDVGKTLRRIAPAGADAVFESTGLPQCIDPAIALCRTQGKFIWQGNYGADPVSMHFLPPHGKRLEMFFPCDDGLAPCRRAVLKNMAMGALAWEEAITHRVEAHEAPALYERINKGRAKDVLGAVVHWAD